jgi:pimeloyl-ACP methyl ester carboxylesterase
VKEKELLHREKEDKILNRIIIRPRRFSGLFVFPSFIQGLNYIQLIIMKLRKTSLSKSIIGLVLLFVVWIFLAQCIIQKERWSDKKAYSVFKSADVPLQIRDTIINTSHLHYAVTGSDTLPTLIFIHGSPGSWMHYMKFLRNEDLRKKFRIVAIDRPGFGYSDFGKAMHLQEQAEIILPVLEKLKTNKSMFLVGHSMGGPVVVKLASMHSSLFEQIVIVAGAIDASQESKETWRKIMNVRPFYWMLPGAFAPSNTELLYLKKDLIPLQNDFKNIKCKVLFIHGDRDTWVPIQNIAYGKKMMVNASKICADTLKGADHQIPWKNFDELKNILLGLN